MDKVLAYFTLPGTDWLHTIGAGVALTVGWWFGRMLTNVLADLLARLQAAGRKR